METALDADSNSEDDDDTLRAKRARRAMLRPSSSVGGKSASAALRVAVPSIEKSAAESVPAALRVPTPAPCDYGRQSTASPSMRWNPGTLGADVRAGDIGVSLPTPATSEGDAAYRLLLSQNAAIMAEMAKQSQQLISLQGLVYHLCRELGAVHNAPHMLPQLTQLFNPYTDQAERPGPLDEAPSRGLDPREIGWLHSQIEQLSAQSGDRCEGFRRIVDPLGWHQLKQIDIPLVDLTWRTQWQLWHYAFGDPAKTSVATVMSAEELEFSSSKKAQNANSPLRPLLHEDTFRTAQFQLFAAQASTMRHQQQVAMMQASGESEGAASTHE